MKGLFFDTETTGLWNKKLPCGHPDQPKLTQIAAILEDTETRVEIMRMNLIVFREDPIPEASSNVHGTTTEISQQIGIFDEPIIEVFMGMVDAADAVIAHNTEFDINILNNALRLMSGNPKADMFIGKTPICTMLRAVPVCRFPNKNGYTGFAWPRLEDAIRKLLDREPTDAHQAIGDVLDCRDLYYYLEDLIKPKAAEVA